MPEYDRLDAEFYDYYSTGTPGDADFYVAEAVQAGSPVLELGSGTGRITFPIAQAGVQITGVDLAPAMLTVARRKLARLAPEVRQRVRLAPGDMRSFQLAERFNLAIIPYRAFLYMYTPADQRLALENIRAHLAPGGRLIFNIFDPRLDILANNTSALRLEGEFTFPPTGRKMLVFDTRSYDLENQLINQYFIFEEVDQQGLVVNKYYVPLKLRYLHRYEMQNMLELSGFRIEALYGDFNRGPFHYGGEQVWVAQPK